MADYLMGIDYGTGGAKTAIIDVEGRVLSYAFREFPIIMNRPGWSEHDPRLYWDSTCQMIREALTNARIEAAEIRGLSLSSAMPALVMVDKNQQPINMAYNLMDRRATAEVQWCKDKIGLDRIFSLTANRLEDHPTLVNLLWERNNRPDDFRRVAKALSIDSYVRLKLTGRAAANYSVLCLYGVWNIVENCYDEALIEQVGLDRAIFPEPFPCGEIIGAVTRPAAEETGLQPGTPVTSGQLDCNAGWVGAGAIAEGDVQINLGTVGNFGIIHKDTNFLKSMLAAAYTIDSHHTYVTVPSTMTGGMSIRYLHDNFSQVEIETERVLGVDAYELLNLQAGKVSPGSDSLIILPYLMGERSPLWDVNARGVIFGLSLNHGKGHLVRAMMEAVAYALYHNFVLVKEARSTINYPFVFNEGGAKSPLWRRIITDILNVPTVLVTRRTGAPFGDAILSGVATGIFKDFGVAREWAEYIEPMEPDQNHHDRYIEYYSIYRNLYEHVKEDLADLARLRTRYG